MKQPLPICTNAWSDHLTHRTYEYTIPYIEEPLHLKAPHVPLETVDEVDKEEARRRVREAFHVADTIERGQSLIDALKVFITESKNEAAIEEAKRTIIRQEQELQDAHVTFEAYPSEIQDFLNERNASLHLSLPYKVHLHGPADHPSFYFTIDHGAAPKTN